ncbi:hypothetical protein GF325_15640 [Candidatus Bathyarchaeota archaeon]|nr:hypothetical protein [Candidatus Bathyarchaeota archaeon]
MKETRGKEIQDSNEKRELKHLFLISHTHWDREWYLTLEEFRLRLVNVMDVALERANEPGWHSFMLDGQVAPLEDYLAVKPGKRAELKNAVSTGKIKIGPWYVLADEFLESAEGLVRNLLIGYSTARQFGEPMKVGYVPDTFGHVWQLPQILVGFGIRTCYLFRGYPPLFAGHQECDGLNDDTPLEFYWRAPDGSKVLTLHHITGYGNCANLDESFGEGEYRFIGAISRLLMAVEALSPRTATGAYLLMNGSDHLYPDAGIPALVEAFNADPELAGDMFLKHGSLEMYFAAMQRDSWKIPELAGEMRGSAYTQVTPACLSTRMYLKLANWEASNLLETIVEPLNVVAWYLGAKYPREKILLAWKEILLNHPHDSICGCSIDRVHEAMETRFAGILDMLNSLFNAATNYIIQAIKALDPGDGARSSIPLVVFNLTNWEQDGPVEMLVSLPRNFRQKSLEILDAGGNRLPEIHVQEIEDYRCLEGGDRLYPRFGRDFAITRLKFMAREIPALGYKILQILPKEGDMGDIEESKSRNILQKGAGTGDPGDAWQGMLVLENDFLKVTVFPVGTIDILDKNTGKEWREMMLFEDAGDDGDTYDHAPLHEPLDIVSTDFPATIEHITRNPFEDSCELNIIMQVPVGLTASRTRSEKLVEMPLKVRVSLHPGEPMVRLHVDVENTARDHRLRILFPTGLDCNISHASDHFMVMDRPIALPKDDGWYQPAQGLYHTDGFVDLNDGTDGLAVHVKGLPEFEILNHRNTIAITLFRSVGFLSRDGMPIARGHQGRPSGLNGPFLPTPGAQCLRKMSFDLAIQPHEGNWNTAGLHAHCKRFQVPLRGVMDDGKPFYHVLQQRRSEGMHPVLDAPSDCFISIEPGTLVVSAIKKAERERGIIIRLYNPGGEPVHGTISLSIRVAAVSRVNLREEFLESIHDLEEGSFAVDFKPYQIQTYLVLPRRFK